MHRLATHVLPGLLLASTAVAQTFSGSFFTVDRNGNGDNTFGSPTKVYLAGGPGTSCANDGLPDDTYVFQVTDPSGETLLTPGPISDRVIFVTNGVISGAQGRATRNTGPCNSLIVQLAPFGETPSSGNEYKVWITPLSAYQTDNSGSFGFLSTNSKSTNFKSKRGRTPDQTTIRGFVFYDLDDDGVFDEGEQPIGGWKILFSGDGRNEILYTNTDGAYEVIVTLDGTTSTFTSVAPPPGFIPGDNADWAPTPIDPTLAPPAPPPVPTGTADATAPAVAGPDFGNLFFVPKPELGRSKGFFHGPEGREVLRDCDPLWRTVINGLYLRRNITWPADVPDPDDTLFLVEADPGVLAFDPAFDQLSAFLVNSVFGVKANVLSTHYAAANLNRSCFVLSGPVFIDRFGDGTLYNVDAMIESTRALLMDDRAGNTGPGGDAEYTALIEQCLQEWDQMGQGDNTNGPGANPPSFESPY